MPDPPAVPISYLNTLRERIETDSPLEFKDQAQLVFELRGSFPDGGAAEEITDLLQRLGKRDELFATDELLGDINRGQRGSLSSKGHIVSNDTPEEVREDQVRKPGSEDGTGGELKLDSAIAQCGRLMERVLNKGECWVFEIDPKNRFAVAFEASAATPCIMVKATLAYTIGSAKAAELKKLGWTVDSGNRVKNALVGAAVFLAPYLFGRNAAPLLSRGVRDTFKELEANRSWMIASPTDAVIDAAVADLILAIRSVAPEAKTIFVRLQEA